MTIAERLFALKSIPVFARLRESELTLIAEVAQVRRYNENEVVCSVDKPLRRLHLVLEGKIVNSDGAATPSVFSIPALLFDLPVQDTLRAASPEGATCLMINRGNLFTTINECPGLVAGLLDTSGANDLLTR